jgi:hypothetical protein
MTSEGGLAISVDRTRRGWTIISHNRPPALIRCLAMPPEYNLRGSRESSGDRGDGLICLVVGLEPWGT